MPMPKAFVAIMSGCSLFLKRERFLNDSSSRSLSSSELPTNVPMSGTVPASASLFLSTDTPVDFLCGQNTIPPWA